MQAQVGHAKTLANGALVVKQRRSHGRLACKAAPALSLRSHDVAWETATPSGPFCPWPNAHASPASLTRKLSPPGQSAEARPDFAAGVAQAWSGFIEQVWPVEEKRLPPEVEALAGGYTDGLPGCDVNRDSGLLALWRYQGFKL